MLTTHLLRTLRGVFATAICLIPALASYGQGIIFPRPIIQEQPFLVKSVRVSAVISDTVAETTVEQVFVNNSHVEQEGTYLFPLPEGASVTSFSLRAGDRVLEGKLLSKEEARGVYEAIVRQRKDPGLLEYVGRGMFRSSVFPIPAHGERALTLKYVEVLKPEGVVRKYVYPLTTGRYSSRIIEATSVSVKLKTTTALKTVYSPTHDVSVRRSDDYLATASWEAHSTAPDRDFVLYFATNGADVGLSLLTHRTGDRDGYFMLIASPRYSTPKDRILPKQVVFVLDRTGSMSGNHKIEQARNALKYCLDNLNASDRFNVITFNESPDTLNRTLVPATEANVEKARRYVRDIEASGGTNIDEALKVALELLKKEPPSTQKMVVFLTDGLPTVGVTEPDRILADVRDLNKGEHLASRNGLTTDAAAVKARIFCFGVGYDVNVPFLDKMAEDSRAVADYVRPEENIEAIVSAFYGKVASPILSNLQLAFNGVETYDVYPKALPDLFKNGQVVITGRYRGDDPGTVKLTGFAQGHEQVFTLAKAFGANSADSGLVPRIWATRKIGFLLDEVRLHDNKEVVDEIVRLSKDFGIITPYTSYLADERQDGIVTPMSLDGGLAYRFDRRGESVALDLARQDVYANSGAAASGLNATYRALNSRGYQEANQSPSNAQAAFGRAGAQNFGGYGGAVGGGFGNNMGITKGLSRSQASTQFADAADALKANAANDANVTINKQMQEVARVQAAGGKTYYRRGDIWFDNAYKDGTKVVKVKAFSDAYFKVLRAYPTLCSAASVGPEVVVMLGANALQFGAEGKEDLTDTELKRLKG